MLLAVCQEFGLGAKDTVIPAIAFGFAGGIGNTGSVCGAVAGATMAIGLKLGRGKTMKDGLTNIGVVQEFRRRFESEMEHINCRDLTGIDFTVREGFEKYMASDIGQRVCFPAVGLAYELVVDLLKDFPKSDVNGAE